MSGKQGYWGYLKMKLSEIQKISSALGERYYTAQLMLNLFDGLNCRNVVQFGCQKKGEFNYHDTLFEIVATHISNKHFAKFCVYHNKDKNHSQLQSSIYTKYDRRQISIKDISEYKQYKQDDIDLLILNDIDYPIKELTRKLNKQLNHLEARNILNSIDEKEFEYLYGSLVHECRKRVLKEYKTFSKHLSRRAIVVLEGNDYPGGSQTLLAKRQLEREGFICLLDLKQSVWVRR